MVMIPSMLINLYVNLACIKLPERYPEQWEKRSIRMGKGLYYICCVLGAICAAIVAFNLFKDLNMQNAIICTGIIIALVGLSYWRLKIGAVKKEDLELRKEQIVKAALAAEE